MAVSARGSGPRGRDDPLVAALQTHAIRYFLMRSGPSPVCFLLEGPQGSEPDATGHLLKESPYVRAGLRRAGFAGGRLAAASESFPLERPSSGWSLQA